VIGLGLGAMYGTKSYEFIGFGAMDVSRPYQFIGFGAMDDTVGKLLIVFERGSTARAHKNGSPHEAQQDKQTEREAKTTKTQHAW
jgi:hypothetical protein